MTPHPRWSASGHKRTQAAVNMAETTPLPGTHAPNPYNEDLAVGWITKYFEDARDQAEKFAREAAQELDTAHNRLSSWNEATSGERPENRPDLETMAEVLREVVHRMLIDEEEAKDEGHTVTLHETTHIQLEQSRARAAAVAAYLHARGLYRDFYLDRWDRDHYELGLRPSRTITETLTARGLAPPGVPAIAPAPRAPD
ncbi:hypothetical protein [Streptomyces sp. KR80]|uniref:hypothetical protein n=1 Tax=Streptomyces sp. KR80 TaxID=3457426 RepID=UPI003FCEF8ED